MSNMENMHLLNPGLLATSLLMCAFSFEHRCAQPRSAASEDVDLILS